LFSVLTLQKKPPTNCTQSDLLSAQSKVFMLNRGNGVKNERKMTGNFLEVKEED
jgi:hypothetical protein